MCFLLMALSVFSGCGEAEDSNSKLVTIDAFPSNPKVFSQGFSIDDGDITIDGPWFLLQLTGHNTSDRNLIIVSIVAKIKTSTGADFEWTPDLPDNVTFMGAANANSAVNWLVNGNLGGGVLSLVAYVDGLPQNEQSLNFRVTLEIDGWFTESADDPDTPQNELIIPVESFSKKIILRAKEG